MEINSKEGKIVVIVSSDKKRVNSNRIAKGHKSISFLSNILTNSNAKASDASKKEYA